MKIAKKGCPLPYKQRVRGSNPCAPTTRNGKSKQNPEVQRLRDFLFMAGTAKYSEIPYFASGQIVGLFLLLKKSNSIGFFALICSVLRNVLRGA